MPTVHRLRFAGVAIAAGLLLAGGAIALGQDTQAQQAQSVADAARRAREQKKNATKPSKVISDDDLDAKRLKPGAQGVDTGAPAKLETQPPSADAVAEAKANDQDAAAGKSLLGKTDPEIEKLKEQVAEAQKQLDLTRRELALDQDSFLSNPDHARDRAGQAKLDALQQEITAKQPELDKLKARLDALVLEKASKGSSPK